MERSKVQTSASSTSKLNIMGFIFRFLLFIVMVAGLHAENYYVSSSAGNDGNTETSAGAPWKTIAKLNSMTFQPGDTIYLKAGDEWNEGFVAHGSGTAVSPILFTRYGEGARPVIKLNYEAKSWCIWLNDLQGWKITDLELCNSEQGIMLKYHSVSTADKDFLWVENCYMHDIHKPFDLQYVYDDKHEHWGTAIFFYQEAGAGRVSNITVKNCISDNNDGFFEMYSQGLLCGLTIDGCTIMHSWANATSLWWPVTVPGFPNVMRNTVYSDNGGIVPFSPGITNIMAGHAPGMLIEVCEFNNMHRLETYDGCAIDYEWADSNMQVKNCYFSNNIGVGILLFGAVGSPNKDILIDGNIFINHPAGAFQFINMGDAGNISNNVYYNSTIPNNRPSGITFISNVEGTKQIVATPVLSLAAGGYATPQTVNLSCGTSDMEIRYTTNGSMPNASSTLYTEPINVTTTLCLNAKAFKAGYENSETKSCIYQIGIKSENTDTGFVLLSPNPLTNPGFETPVVQGYQYAPSNSGWVFSGGGSGIQRNGSAFQASEAPEGVQTAFLQSSASWVSQSVHFDNGLYKVKFKASLRTTFPGTQTTVVYFDSINIGGFTPTGSAFVEFTTDSFTASAGEHTIKFVGTTEGDHTDFIDNIRIHQHTKSGTTVSQRIADAKKSFLMCYPNPFNSSTIISFSIPTKSFVSLKVFDVVGREVATIVSEKMSAGTYLRQWNASKVSSGIYFYHLQAGSYSETKKLVLLR